MKKILFLYFITQIANCQNVFFDNSFATAGFLRTVVNASGGGGIRKIKMLSDGKIISMGYRQSVDVSILHLSITKTNTNGTPDNSFGVNGLVNINIGDTESPQSLAIQTDNKIVVAGSCVDTGFQRRGFIARFNTDGTLDTTFGINGIAKYNFLNNNLGCLINHISILPNNQLITSANTSNGNLILKINSDGSINTTFGTNGYVELNTPNYNLSFLDIEGLNDNTIILSGSDITNTNDTKIAIAKLNPDGSFFNSFGVNGVVRFDLQHTFSESALQIVVQSDNKLSFNAFSGGQSLIIRLLPDGSPDTTLAGTGILGLDYTSRDFDVQPNGKIIIAGMTSFGTGNDGYSITRYNADGTLDDTNFSTSGIFNFNPTPTNDYLDCIKIINSNQVFLGGASRVNGIFNFSLSKLLVDQNLSIDNYYKKNLTIYPNPNNGDFRINNLDNFSIIIYDLLGQEVFNKRNIKENFTIQTNLKNGIYILKTINEIGKINTEKIVVQ